MILVQIQQKQSMDTPMTEMITLHPLIPLREMAMSL